VLSNFDVYFAIAEEALRKSKELGEAHRAPKPDGTPGYILRFDPERQSFKQALISIVFSCISLEDLLYIYGIQRFGKKKYRERLSLSCPAKAGHPRLSLSG